MTFEEQVVEVFAPSRSAIEAAIADAEKREFESPHLRRLIESALRVAYEVDALRVAAAIEQARSVAMGNTSGAAWDRAMESAVAALRGEGSGT